MAKSIQAQANQFEMQTHSTRNWLKASIEKPTVKAIINNEERLIFNESLSILKPVLLSIRN